MNKHILTTICMLVAFQGIHAQESAFEMLLPLTVNTLTTHCRETSDGGFLFNPGITNKILKLSNEGEILKEVDYLMDGPSGSKTRIIAFLDVPDNPSLHLVVTQLTSQEADTGNLFHIVTFDDDLCYEPADVRVVDLSDWVKLVSGPDNPCYNLEEDGSVSFAATAYTWDDVKRLMFARISPDGAIIVGFNDQFDDQNSHAKYFTPMGDRYVLVAYRNITVSSGWPVEQNLNYFEVSRDLSITDSVFCIASSLLSQSLQHVVNQSAYSFDTCFVACNPNASEFTVPTWLSDSIMLIPTTVRGYLHNISNNYYNGIGLWKLDRERTLYGQRFFDVVFNDKDNYEELWNLNPLLFNGEYVYLCYTTYQGSFSKPAHTMICKLDTELNLIWKRWFGNDEGFYYVTDFALTSDGGCLASGTGNKNPAQYGIEPLPYVLKVSPDGYCSVKENEEPLLKPYCFFPNPVDDRLHMEFSPDVTPRQIELYDLQGRLVGIQNNGFEGVEMGQLPSGVYTLRVIMEDGTSYSNKVVKQ